MIFKFKSSLKFAHVFRTTQVYQSLVELTKDIKGAKVEHNKFCASVHYRNVDEQVRKLLCLVNLGVMWIICQKIVSIYIYVCLS